MHDDSFFAGASLNDIVDQKKQYHGLDTPERICFYENDHYYLSNFSSFQIVALGMIFPTSEHLYHWTRFKLANTRIGEEVAERVLRARSAHDAFKLAQDLKFNQVENWDEVKFVEMKKILRLKVDQHEYVKRKLLSTGDSTLVENSFRDNIWGTGPNNDGLNMLGKIWMEVREEYRRLSDRV